MSSVDSYLSDDNDEPDLQQSLIEEQARQRYRRKTKRVSITAILKQINHDCRASINDMVVIYLVEPNHNSGVYQICFYFYIFDLIIL